MMEEIWKWKNERGKMERLNERGKMEGRIREERWKGE